MALDLRKRENKYLAKITNHTVAEMFSMIEGIITVLAHVTQMYVRVSCSTSTKRLTCCCHQCTIHTQATKSELNSVYIASATMHTTEAQIDSYFSLPCSQQLFSALSCHTTGKARPENANFTLTKVARNGGCGFANR